MAFSKMNIKIKYRGHDFGVLYGPHSPEHYQLKKTIGAEKHIFAVVCKHIEGIFTISEIKYNSRD